MAAALKLGFDNYAIRSLGWKASQLVDYAGSWQLDVLLLSDFDVYESLNESALRDLKRRADDQGVALYAGMLSICPSSVVFDPKRGTAEEQLRSCLRIARAIGSPVARCVLGNWQDRRSPGGIEAHIADTVNVLRVCRTQALEAGVKIAVENHAGDMQSRELLALVEAAGSDFVGVTMDAGNATWALEDPAHSLELLGPQALCTGIRDSAVWDTSEGAAFGWTAMGDGMLDWHAFFRRYAELCPDTPVLLETISGRTFTLPYLQDEFWSAYADASPREFARFLALARRGRARPQPAPDLALNPAFQQAELERSIRYCREVLGIGRRT